MSNFNEKCKAFLFELGKKERKVNTKVNAEEKGIFIGVDNSKKSLITFNEWSKSNHENSISTGLMGLGMKSRNKEFVCTECGIICYSVIEIQSHMKIFHDINLVEYDSVGKEYKTIDLGEAEILEEERKVNK